MGEYLYMAFNEKLRNVGIFAHIDAGKTTITENMLYISGKIHSTGSVDRGTAHTDFLDVERERGISVRSASTSFPWKGVNINLIDTPGHVDFSAEVERSIRVLDCAVLVISAVEGVQAQTEILWKALRAMNIPTILFMNKIDRVGSDIKRVLSEIHHSLSKGSLCLQYVTGEETANPIITDIWPLKGSSTEKVRKMQDDMIERLADLDEHILEQFIGGRHISLSEIDEKAVSYASSGKAFPVFFGSALKGIGITQLMDGIVKYFHGPNGSPILPLAGVVFGIIHDHSIGRAAYVRLYNGSIKTRDIIFNASQNIDEKVTQIRKIDTGKYDDAGVIYAGDIGAVCGLTHAKIGDILGDKDAVPGEFHLSTPFLKVQAYPDSEAEYPKLVDALQELGDEDPMLEVEWLHAEKQIHLKIMGIIQMEVLSSILKSRFGLNVSFGKTSVIYKETPTCSGEGFVSYTMPKPCWAVLRFLIEPLERGSGVVFSSVVRTEYIQERYQKQVEKTLPQALTQGIYGWEVTDIKITLIGGEHHVKHTRPPDFAIATSMGIMDGLNNTGITLLEPTLKFHISAPEGAGGKILNDLDEMRGTFDSPVIIEGVFDVDGVLPASTSMDYHIRLASITGGRGTIKTSFSGYRECPKGVAEVCERRGVNPLDRSRYILYARNALAQE